MDLFEAWRLFNIILAFTAAILWFVLKVQPTWNYIPGYRAMASLALLAYPLAYGVAAAWAQAQEVAAGPWTMVMSVPIFWTFVAAIVGEPDRKS